MPNDISPQPLLDVTRLVSQCLRDSRKRMVMWSDPGDDPGSLDSYSGHPAVTCLRWSVSTSQTPRFRSAIRDEYEISVVGNSIDGGDCALISLTE